MINESRVNKIVRRELRVFPCGRSSATYAYIGLNYNITLTFLNSEKLEYVTSDFFLFQQHISTEIEVECISMLLLLLNLAVEINENKYKESKCGHCTYVM